MSRMLQHPPRLYIRGKDKECSVLAGPSSLLRTLCSAIPSNRHVYAVTVNTSETRMKASTVQFVSWQRRTPINQIIAVASQQTCLYRSTSIIESPVTKLSSIYTQSPGGEQGVPLDTAHKQRILAA